MIITEISFRYLRDGLALFKKWNIIGDSHLMNKDRAFQDKE